LSGSRLREALTGIERAPSGRANTNGNTARPAVTPAALRCQPAWSMPLLSLLIKLFDIGITGMADALVETVASSSPANPIARAVFDMTHISSLQYGFHPSIPQECVTLGTRPIEARRRLSMASERSVPPVRHAVGERPLFADTVEKLGN
jgi:hypothetical protein